MAILACLAEHGRDPCQNNNKADTYHCFTEPIWETHMLRKSRIESAEMGRKGGIITASRRTAEERKGVARKAARARWNKKRESDLKK